MPAHPRQPIARCISAAPMPRLRQDGSTANGPSSNASWRRHGRATAAPSRYVAMLAATSDKPVAEGGRRAAGAKLGETNIAIGGVEQRFARDGIRDPARYEW